MTEWTAYHHHNGFEWVQRKEAEQRITKLEADNTRLQAQLDKVRDAFNIPDWQDCVNAIKAALEDEDVNSK